MYTISNNSNNTIIVKNSKFICYIFRVTTVEQFENTLKDLKNEYNDSTHICYGYIINNLEKAYDDKEPNGTAGISILNVLKTKQLNNVCSIVIRYFGGIKLGTGGLARAYTKAIIDTLNSISIVELFESFLIIIRFNYNQKKIVNSILKNIKNIKKVFGKDITYEFYISKNEENLLEDLKSIKIHINIKKKVLIEKY